MPRKKAAFTVLARLAGRARSERARQLQQARQSLTEQQAQVDSLKAIAADYADRSGDQSHHATVAKGRFRLRLWALVDEQEARLRALEAEVAQALARYQASHRQLLSYERLDERSQAAEQERLARHARRQMGFHSSSMLNRED